MACGQFRNAGRLSAKPHRGQVEVISRLEHDGRPVFRDLRWGVYVNFAADSDYVRRCFKEYGLQTDDSGLAHGVNIAQRAAKSQAVTLHDVAAPDSEAVRVRREMESMYRGAREFHRDYSH